MGIKTLSLTGKMEDLQKDFRRVYQKHRQRKPIGSREYHLPIYHYLVRETEETFLENNTISPYIDDMRALL